MGLMEKALSAFGLQRKSAMTWSNGVESGTAGDAGETVTQTSALALSAVWACTNLISGAISTLPLPIMGMTKAGVREQDRAHPLHDLLSRSPNYDQTIVDFMDFLSMSIELNGNGYAQKVRGPGGRVIALVPVKPDLMSVRRLQSGALEYRWSADGKSNTGTDQDVLHIRGPGGDPLGGMSTLTFARNSFSAAQAAERAAAGMFRNGLRPSALIKFKEWLTPEQRTIAHDNIQTKYQGAINAGKPFIAEGGMEYQSLTITPEDAQMLETRQHSVTDICRFFGVPPVMVGHADNGAGWPSSVEAQMQIFYQLTLRRRLVRIEKTLMKQLLAPEDQARGVVIEFNIEGLLRGDSAGRSAFYGSGLKDGWLTINEVRGKENLAPVPGGDVPRMQSQNVPITQAGQGANNGNQGV